MRDLLGAPMAKEGGYYSDFPVRGVLGMMRGPLNVLFLIARDFPQVVLRGSLQ